MRAFVRLREVLSTHKKLAKKLNELENKYDSQFRIVFEAIRQLMKEDEKPKTPIGFHLRRGEEKPSFWGFNLKPQREDVEGEDTCRLSSPKKE